MRKKMTIVMTTDQNYILQTKIAIWSMLNAAEKDIFFDIFILCSCQLGQEKREKIYELQKNRDNIYICFKEIDERIFQNAQSVSYIPVSSFYRLVIGDIIEDTRCLFLDGDIIVNTDLSEVYNTDLSGKYIAGVRDCMLQCSEEYKSYGDVIGIPTMEGYVNAGVLMMNLDLIRKDGMIKTFIACMDDYYQMMDQDIMNKCCFGKIGHLSLKYNLFAEYYKKGDRLENTAFTPKEIDDADTQFGIMHFPGRYKPWNFIRMRGSNLWWERAEKALSQEEYCDIYEAALESTRKSDWSYVLEKCGQANDVVIIGFSDKGKDVADSLERCGMRNIRCFCDNDKEKQLLEYNNLTVYSVDEAYEKFPQALWVNTSQAYAGKINNQLTNKGIEKEKILVYIYKTKQYYDNLDEQYQNYEAEQLALKQCGIEI